MFDYERFEKIASLGLLAKLGCAREVLRHGACRYALASSQLGERRAGLRKAGITYKQLTSKAAAARDLSGFLKRLRNNPWFVLANVLPRIPVPVWCEDLEDMARWIEGFDYFHPKKNDAALALALHVKKRTGRRQLSEIARLLNAALSAASLPGSLTTATLEKQLTRANRERAKSLLDGWESLPPARLNRK